MPVEIKELVIRAIAQSNDLSTSQVKASKPAPWEKQALIEACVREVLRILKRAEER